MQPSKRCFTRNKVTLRLAVMKGIFEVIGLQGGVPKR